MYKTPYPPAYNQIPLPHKYKMPDFTKFSEQGEVSIMKPVNMFLLQLGEAGKLHIVLGRSGEIIPSALLLWSY
jgi:hypothetical protein